jgi:hypothetical protein
VWIILTTRSHKSMPAHAVDRPAPSAQEPVARRFGTGEPAYVQWTIAISRYGCKGRHGGRCFRCLWLCLVSTRVNGDAVFQAEVRGKNEVAAALCEDENLLGTSTVSTGRHSFKLNDTARLIRATVAAGLKIKGVTLNGSTVTILVDGAQDAGSDKANPWDEALDDDTDKKRAP